MAKGYSLRQPLNSYKYTQIISKQDIGLLDTIKLAFG